MANLHKLLLLPPPASTTRTATFAHSCAAQQHALQLPAGDLLVPRAQTPFEFMGASPRRHSCTAIIPDGNAAEPDGPASLSDLQQRTREWFQLRKDRLTASAFSSALGFWKDGRVELWKQKVGLVPAFMGNTATQWGIDHEAEAVQAYAEITKNNVKRLAFHIYKDEDSDEGWLGASPDGLIDRDVLASYDKGGILEVKCPHNNGQPEFSVPCHAVPYYHMPQIQGLMEILDRDWLDLYIWTVNGSTLFRLDRDPEYWILLFGGLHEFWWSNVVPAKQAILEGRNSDLYTFQPAARHKSTPKIIAQSKILAAKAKVMLKTLTITENLE